VLPRNKVERKSKAVCVDVCSKYLVPAYGSCIQQPTVIAE